MIILELAGDQHVINIGAKKGGNMDDYLGDFKDVDDEITKDEPEESILPTDMELFWESILTAKEALEDAVVYLMASSASDRPGEIKSDTEHFMNISAGVAKALRELNDVWGEKRI